MKKAREKNSSAQADGVVGAKRARVTCPGGMGMRRGCGGERAGLVSIQVAVG